MVVASQVRRNERWHNVGQKGYKKENISRSETNFDGMSAIFATKENSYGFVVPPDSPAGGTTKPVTAAFCM